jgi:hypothetical protein
LSGHCFQGWSGIIWTIHITTNYFNTESPHHVQFLPWMYLWQTSPGKHPSISFVRISLILATQYCHYYEHSKFWRHHQITFSMIVCEWEHSSDHNSIRLHFSHITNLPNLFFFVSYILVICA